MHPQWARMRQNRRSHEEIDAATHEYHAHRSRNRTGYDLSTSLSLHVRFTVGSNGNKGDQTKRIRNTDDKMAQKKIRIYTIRIIPDAVIVQNKDDTCLYRDAQTISHSDSIPEVSQPI